MTKVMCREMKLISRDMKLMYKKKTDKWEEKEGWTQLENIIFWGSI